MKWKDRGRGVDTLCAMLLLTTFTVLCLFLVLTGTRVYQKTVTEMGDNNQVRSTLSYVANKVRSSDVQNGVSLTEHNGIPVLMITSESSYETAIYYYDGVLRELYQPSGTEFIPGRGEALASVAGFSMQQQPDGLLYFSVTDSSGGEETLALSLRS